jgi:hypothetical protein
MSNGVSALGWVYAWETPDLYKLHRTPVQTPNGNRGTTNGIRCPTLSMADDGPQILSL